MNDPRFRDVKTGLVIIIRKIMLRSKHNTMTEHANEESALKNRVGPSDLAN